MRIIPKQGVCDPHVHIFNGKAYLFTSHDRGPGMPIYRMDDWQIFSSDDLLNWKLECVVHPEDTFLGKCEECYATDAAGRNGKYYFYFSNQQYCTGVAVSENGPGGPYKDALGKPLLPRGFVNTASYDPTVFIDDDEAKTPYIIFGYTVNGTQYHIARLNEDMISLAEAPRPIEFTNGEGWETDATWISKHNGVYYLNIHGALYATADNIYGPYTMQPEPFCHDGNCDHGTIFNYHNQTYFIYGMPENWGAEKVDPFYRTTKIIYAHYRDNGDIVTDEFIYEAGVGQYDAAWDAIKGEWYFAASDGIYKKENTGGFELRGIQNGSYLYFQNVNGMRQNALIKFLVAAEKPAEIEIREGSPFGAVLGVCKVQPTGGPESFAEVSCRLENTHGTHSLCFVFRGEADEVLHFEHFGFEHIVP